MKGFHSAHLHLAHSMWRVSPREESSARKTLSEIQRDRTHCYIYGLLIKTQKRTHNGIGSDRSLHIRFGTSLTDLSHRASELLPLTKEQLPGTTHKTAVDLPGALTV